MYLVYVCFVYKQEEKVYDSPQGTVCIWESEAFQYLKIKDFLEVLRYLRLKYSLDMDNEKNSLECFI